MPKLIFNDRAHREVPCYVAPTETCAVLLALTPAVQPKEGDPVEAMMSPSDARVLAAALTEAAKQAEKR